MPAIRGAKSKSKTRRRERDVDQVYADLRSPRHLAQFQETKAAEDLPDLGKWYCTECAKWFESENNLIGHRRGKTHKRRVKTLKEEPYTQEEAEAAAGYSHKAKTTEIMDIDAEDAADPAAALIFHQNDSNG